MASQMVASAAAASSDPSWAYPNAKPARAASVPHTSASPNRSRHARHQPAARPGTVVAGPASALPAVTIATAAPSMDTPLIAPPTFLYGEWRHDPDTPPRRPELRYDRRLAAEIGRQPGAVG